MIRSKIITKSSESGQWTPVERRQMEKGGKEKNDWQAKSLKREGRASPEQHAQAFKDDWEGERQTHHFIRLSLSLEARCFVSATETPFHPHSFLSQQLRVRELLPLRSNADIATYCLIILADSFFAPICRNVTAHRLPVGPRVKGGKHEELLLWRWRARGIFRWRHKFKGACDWVFRYKK